MYHIFAMKKKYNELLLQCKKAEMFFQGEISDSNKEKYIEGFMTLNRDINSLLEAIKCLEEVSENEVLNGFEL
jgi:hypothetical protein